MLYFMSGLGTAMPCSMTEPDTVKAARLWYLCVGGTIDQFQGAVQEETTVIGSWYAEKYATGFWVIHWTVTNGKTWNKFMCTENTIIRL